MSTSDLSGARMAARVAYENDVYGHGRDDWQSAEVAAYEFMVKRGQPTGEATMESARLEAGEVVREISDREGFDP